MHIREGARCCRLSTDAPEIFDDGRIVEQLLDAVIFDCDGVLVDSEPLHDAATRDELRSRGIDLDEAFFTEHIGMRVIDQMRSIADRFDVDADELYERREHRFWTSVRTQLLEIPGSVEAVRALHSAGLPIAVATSGTRRWIDHVIEAFDLGSEISATVCGADVSLPKPDPEAYLTASSLLGIDPTRCGVVEDSERGFRSGLQAGCRVVVLDRVQPDGSRRDPALFAGALAVTSTMTEARDVLMKHGVSQKRG